MCIKNNLVEETLKGIRSIEKNSNDLSDRELAEVLVRIKKIQEDLEMSQTKIIKTLKERNYNTVELFPELESKVYLAEGKNNKEYNVQEIFKNFKDFGIVDNFPEYVKVQQTLVDKADEKISTIFANNVTIKVSEPSITVRKMSKQELKESL